jgi:hypothetical protein
MGIKFANNISTTLTVSINAVQTSFDIDSVVGIPALGATDYFYATIVGPISGLEIVKVTGVSGNTVTCLRGQDGTTAQAWVNNSKFEMRVTAEILRGFGSPSLGIYYEHLNTVSTNATIASGNNAVSAGPMTVNSGITVTIPPGSTWAIV